MQIELKNTEFKDLYQFLKQLSYEEEELNIHSIVFNKLKPQYDKAFLKYKDEKPEFKVGDKVKFDKNEEDGVVESIVRLANGQYKYGIQYYYVGDYNGEDKVWYSTVKYLTKKNIRKI